jgi:serine/threonine protein phosphatase PrpC
MFKVFCAKAQGKSHIEKNIPCQDAAAAVLRFNDTVGIVCVADGHGGSKYFRSGKGAKFAVSIAQKSLDDFYGIIATEKAAFFNQRANNDEIKNSDILSKLKQLEGNIIYNWRNDVLQDLTKDHPLTETEAGFCAANNIAIDNSSDLVFIYGTTLLAALVSGNFWFVIQIGDGLSVVLENEENITVPIAEDEHMAFGRTTSLCDTNAIDNFRESFGFNQIKGITVATDGVADSFEQEKYLRFNKELYSKFVCFSKKAENELQKFLPELSERGSHDDVSIAGIFRMEEKKKRWTRVLENFCRIFWIWKKLMCSTMSK